MAKTFPHLRSESAFPDANNINVYKYDNDFDYARYDYSQMQLIVCTVPWDMGEAHVGNRTISGIGNVVYFGSKANRDAWFDSLPDDECCRFETKYKELHRDHVIDVPIPFDMASKHNYLVTRYELFANAESPVMFEGENGHREWFWFIREVEFVAPNTTRLHLLEDAWQTWIYDVDITGMILERGHAPMFATSVGDYLANPLDNNAYLLTEDVNFGEATVTKHIDALSLNDGDMYACICTNSNVIGDWGSKADDDWRVPGNTHLTEDGVPSIRTLAIEATKFNELMEAISADMPQFKQTVKAVFFAAKELIEVSSSITFAGMTCYLVNAKKQTVELTELDKALFGYDVKYADIAKLYTSPYAHIEVTDENGATDIIKIEDTTGTISANVVMGIAYPFITLNAHLSGVGGAASATVTFKNISSKSFTASGKWYETLRTWNVPTFAVVLSPQKEYDYSTHFDRAQRVVDYNTAYDNTTASVATAYTNETKSIETTHDTNVASNNTSYTNEIETQKGLISNKNDAKDCADEKIDNVTDGGTITTIGGSGGYLSETYDAQLNKLSDDTDADQILMVQQTGIATSALAAGAVVNAAGAIGGGITSGASMGAVGGAAGAIVGGVAGGTAQAVTIGASTMIAVTNDQSLCTNNQNHAQAKFNSARKASMALTNAQKKYNKGIKDADNAYLESTVTRFSGTNGINRENALRTKTTGNDNADSIKTTGDNNALRTKNTDNDNATRTKTQAQSAITNDIAQAGLREPSLYGNFANGETATTRPMALFSHIVTQSQGAISTAGDEMLRYGYMLDKQWPFDGNWCVGKHFTYWKLRDFWVSGLSVPDMYMDRLRFFLFGGVTVWANPADIGNVTIYENM